MKHAITRLGQFTALGALLVSGVANAASLQDVHGDVFVNNGSGFAAVKGAAVVAPGDRVRVGAQGGARIVYSDGCTIKVNPGSLTSVSKQSPCSFRASTNNDQDNHLCNPLDPNASQNPLDFACGGYGPWVMGAGLLAAGGIGAAVALNNSGSTGGTNLSGLLFKPAVGGSK